MADPTDRTFVVIPASALAELLTGIVDVRVGHLEARILGVLQDRGPAPIVVDAASPFVSVKELAAKLGVSERTVRRYEKSGRLPRATRIGGVVRFAPAALSALAGDVMPASTARAGGRS